MRKTAKDNNTFITVASHELFNPIVAIRGYLELLKKSSHPQTKEFKENLKYLSDNFDYLQDMVSSLLDVSRIDNNKLLLNFSNVDVEYLIEAVCKQFSLLAQEKNLDLHYIPTLGLPRVYADERRLRQVITNLVSNSIKYTKKGGLTISTEFDKKSVKIHFKDTGIGIPKKEIPHLFQKFHRVHTPDTVDVQGTGLGLWLVKEFIAKMRGKVDIESQEHQGTHVTITLPISK